MREIKFRAWDINEKCFEIIESLYWFEENGVRTSDGNGHSSKYIIEQFTGLHDRNGKEIYEGDVVTSDIHVPQNMEVRFAEGGFCAWWGDDDLLIDMAHFYNSRGCCIEVIGNIHENPELLNGAKS